MNYLLEYYNELKRVVDTCNVDELTDFIHEHIGESEFLKRWDEAPQEMKEATLCMMIIELEASEESIKWAEKRLKEIKEKEITDGTA